MNTPCSRAVLGGIHRGTWACSLASGAGWGLDPELEDWSVEADGEGAARVSAFTPWHEKEREPSARRLQEPAERILIWTGDGEGIQLFFGSPSPLQMIVCSLAYL
ncbi:hypothetical protein NDU88_003155 [Pleurodeles waltl]|uniref:Uncharacterized protein n=1 Tax=Pleurodeles waltl TaxID=8319 RepID=A0AAV7NJ33_PLEWA|nr:hypothetical protein NDU88_003155 [Pleurodeles waltl]